MESFAAQIGEVPLKARRLADFEAQEHRAQWVRRVLGQGICSYVIGYTFDDRWWTYCFERVLASASPYSAEPAPTSDEEELWSIEAYDSSGHSWTETYCYDTVTGRWHKNHESTPLPGSRAGTPRVL
jgi:hypothetical protein